MKTIAVTAALSIFSSPSASHQQDYINLTSSEYEALQLVAHTSRLFVEDVRKLLERLLKKRLRSSFTFKHNKLSASEIQARNANIDDTSHQCNITDLIVCSSFVVSQIDLTSKRFSNFAQSLLTGVLDSNLFTLASLAPTLSFVDGILKSNTDIVDGDKVNGDIDGRSKSNKIRIEAGGGSGFGFQLYCNGQMALTSGAGSGGGLEGKFFTSSSELSEAQYADIDSSVVELNKSIVLDDSEISDTNDNVNKENMLQQRSYGGGGGGGVQFDTTLACEKYVKKGKSDDETNSSEGHNFLAALCSKEFKKPTVDNEVTSDLTADLNSEWLSLGGGGGCGIEQRNPIRKSRRLNSSSKIDSKNKSNNENVQTLFFQRTNLLSKKMGTHAFRPNEASLVCGTQIDEETNMTGLTDSDWVRVFRMLWTRLSDCDSITVLGGGGGGGGTAECCEPFFLGYGFNFSIESCEIEDGVERNLNSRTNIISPSMCGKVKEIYSHADSCADQFYYQFSDFDKLQEYDVVDKGDNHTEAPIASDLIAIGGRNTPTAGTAGFGSGSVSRSRHDQRDRFGREQYRFDPAGSLLHQAAANVCGGYSDWCCVCSSSRATLMHCLNSNHNMSNVPTKHSSARSNVTTLILNCSDLRQTYWRMSWLLSADCCSSSKHNIPATNSGVDREYDRFKNVERKVDEVEDETGKMGIFRKHYVFGDPVEQLIDGVGRESRFSEGTAKGLYTVLQNLRNTLTSSANISIYEQSPSRIRSDNTATAIVDSISICWLNNWAGIDPTYRNFSDEFVINLKTNLSRCICLDQREVDAWVGITAGSVDDFVEGVPSTNFLLCALYGLLRPMMFLESATIEDDFDITDSDVTSRNDLSSFDVFMMKHVLLNRDNVVETKTSVINSKINSAPYSSNDELIEMTGKLMGSTAAFAVGAPFGPTRDNGLGLSIIVILWFTIGLTSLLQLAFLRLIRR